MTEVISEYQVPIAKITEDVILFNLNRSYQIGISAEELYEITRGNWVIGTRRDKAKYAFAVYKGIIREVYEIERWLPAQATFFEVKWKNRWQFEGKVAENLKHYVGASTENYQGVVAQNPIRYVNC